MVPWSTRIEKTLHGLSASLPASYWTESTEEQKQIPMDGILSLRSVSVYFLRRSAERARSNSLAVEKVRIFSR